MAKPAARIGDVHDCPAVSPCGAPHGGGPIVGPGCATVWIEGAPAATVGDACICAGGLDQIISGSTGVFIEGKEAARQGDRCAHGGAVVMGSGTVLIGERKGVKYFSKPDTPEDKNNSSEFVEPSPEEKNRIINQAIQECIYLLERKLKLLEERDGKTMEDFKTWFGCIDEALLEFILSRTRRALKAAKELTLNNFSVIADEHTRIKSFAFVWSENEFHTIYLGNLFWSEKHTTKRSRSSVLVHELSHFDDIGSTEDVDYGVDQCLYLSNNEPRNALLNAENYELFIKA